LATQPEIVTVDSEEYYQWKVVLRVPKNWTPESGVFIAVAPPGGIANFPAAIQGEVGFSPTFRNVDLTELEPDDPTEASAEVTLITPATDIAGPVYDLALTLHRGATGADGTLTILAADDLDDTGAAAGMILALKSDGAGGYNGVQAITQKVGNMYWPTSIATVTDANGANPLTSVVIPGQKFPWRGRVQGQQIVAPNGPDVQVDLVARLGGTGTGTGAEDGLAIARGQGLAGGAAQNLMFSPAPPIGSSPGFAEVAASGSSTIVYIRLEQVGSGTDTFSAVPGRGLFCVEVAPVA
jgi:hypothetical protein